MYLTDDQILRPITEFHVLVIGLGIVRIVRIVHIVRIVRIVGIVLPISSVLLGDQVQPTQPVPVG